MIDLGDAFPTASDEAAADLRTGDVARAVMLLRGEAELSVDLRALLADVLEGKLKVRQGAVTLARALTPNEVRREVETWARVLRGEATGDAPEDAFERAVALAQAAGWEGAPQTRGEATKAARLIVAHLLGVTPAALDEAMHPRRARQKSRETRPEHSRKTAIRRG